MFHDDHLLIILHEVPRPGDPARQGIFVWRNPQGHWRTSGAGAGRGGVGMGPLTALLERYETAVDDLELQLANADAADDYFKILRHGAPLKRAAGNMRQALQTARESLRLDKHVIIARDRAIDIARAAELLVEDAKNALDFAVAQQAEEQNRMSHELAKSAQRLNVVMALFMPLTAAAGVFGMNLQSGVDMRSPLWFWGVLAVGLAFGVLFAKSGRIDRSKRAPAAVPDQTERPFVLSARNAS